jgi:hypothetical protein
MELSVVDFRLKSIWAYQTKSTKTQCEFRVSSGEMSVDQFAIGNPKSALFVRLEGFEPTTLSSVG